MKKLTESFAVDLFKRNGARKIHVIGFLVGFPRLGCVGWNRGGTWRYKPRHFFLKEKKKALFGRKKLNSRDG